MKNSDFNQDDKRKVRLSVSISTGLLLSLLLLLNWLSIRYPLRYELAGNKSGSLAPESIAIVKKLQRPLQITIYDRAINPVTDALLSNYQNQNDNFKYQLVEPDSSPTSEQGDILLEYGTTTKTLQGNSNLLGSEITEAQLSNAMLKILEPATPYLYWLEPTNGGVNSSKTSYAKAISQLQAKGYQVKSLNLVNYQVPENASAIAIVKPLQKLSEVEVTRLQDYLDRGGSLLVMLLPNTRVGLDPIWREYGIELDNRLLIDGSSNSDRLPIEIKTDRYTDTLITNNLTEATIFANSRPLKIIPQSQIVATPLVTTSDRIWAENDLSQPEIGFDPQQDLTGNLPLAVALEKNNASRLVVFGNSAFANNTWFEQGANKELFLATVNWLAGLDRDALEIPEPQITHHRISLEPWQSRLIVLLGTKIFPGIAAIVAILLWLFKRKKARVNPKK